MNLSRGLVVAKDRSLAIRELPSDPRGHLIIVCNVRRNDGSVPSVCKGTSELVVPPMRVPGG